MFLADLRHNCGIFGYFVAFVGLLATLAREQNQAGYL